MSTNFFLKSGKQFKVSSKEALDIHERLPLATYTVGFDCDSSEYFLETIESFEINHKLYGNTNRYADRIMNTFNDRDVSTGVLLTGEKGSGKTLLAKRISILAASQGIPTIVINTDYCGEQFNEFLQMIEQPVIILFDEFEKVYDEYDGQEKMLTLLDGVYSSKKLFLLTCNNKSSINCNMLNRPGRIYYALDYNGIDEIFIREYCNDNLNNKEHIQNVCTISNIFRVFNFDMLKAMVEEMNRYDESPMEVLEFLNARPEFDTEYSFTLKLFKNNKNLKIGGDDWQGCPLKERIDVYIYDDDHDDDDDTHLQFTVDELVSVDSTTKAYRFHKEKDGYILDVTPKKNEYSVDYKKLQQSSNNNNNNMSKSTTTTTKDIELNHIQHKEKESNNVLLSSTIPQTTTTSSSEGESSESDWKACECDEMINTF